MRVRRLGLVQLMGIVGAVVAWLGWFEVAPALGFPTIGPAAMLNRVFVPKSDPGVWLGWFVMALGLLAVAALYALATARGWIQPGPLAGSLFGLAAWAIAGMALMVIIGHVSPPAPAPPAPPGPPLPTSPDPMHATFLMLHLGVLAPLGALAAWLLFGAVLGATSAVEAESATAVAQPHRGGAVPAAGLIVLGAAVFVAVWIAGPDAYRAEAQGTAGVEIRTLATGPAKALPDGAVFVSVIGLPQAPGAKLGPHAHVPGFAYVLRGRETISFPGQPTLELDSGEGGFMGALAIHAHENRDRVPAAILAAGLLAIGLVLATLALGKVASRRALTALAGLLVVAGAVALWNPWANDWYFVAVRPGTARGGVMPLPNATRVYESPDLEGLSAGPYSEALRTITVQPGGEMTVDQEPGAETFLILSGRGELRVDGGSAVSLATSQAALAQQGAFVRLSNSGAETLAVLSFSVAASGGSR
jgi:quercetin dioxygenase-like cupin family protein